ncbi:hypothetical protein BSF44_54540 [Pseudomonas sp. ACN8]|nr:hypothetical protein BSF44_54540 [Pseudomonas sp. ACN8]
MPYVGAKPFAYFSAFGKVSRRKGETISRRYRSNGYVLNQPTNLVGPKAAKFKSQDQAKLLLTTSNTSLDNCPEARIRSSSPFIKA